MPSPSKPEIGQAVYKCRTHGFDIDLCVGRCDVGGWVMTRVVPCDEAAIDRAGKALAEWTDEPYDEARDMARFVLRVAGDVAQNDEAPAQSGG